LKIEREIALLGRWGNFLGKALAVALGHTNDTIVYNRIKRMAGSVTPPLLFGRINIVVFSF
jgi:hypothetical protein